MMEFSKRPAVSWARQAFVGIACLAFLLSGDAAFGASNDETNPPVFQMPKTGMKSGRITAKHDASVQISGKDYAFHQNVEFWTDEEQQLPWKEFNRGDEVQFHLKQEKIDYLVLITPK